MNIEKLKPSDWENYKELKLRAHREEQFAFDATDENFIKRTDERWQQAIDDLINPPAMCFVAINNNEMVGIVYGTGSKFPKVQHVLDIEFLYVAPEARGKGTGKKLMNKIMGEIISDPIYIKINLRVCTAQIAAVELYKSLGFEIISEMKKERFVDGKYYDDYKMSLFLK